MTRPGAFTVYISIWDIDIFDFLDIKKKSGEDRRRCHDLFPAVVIDDVYMTRLKNREKITLFSPYDARNLTELYGEEFKKEYIRLEQEFIKNPDKFCPNTKQVDAIEIFRKLAPMFMDEGQPFIYFKDIANRKHKVPELGIIRSSNLCMEILQATDEDHTAVCNLGSINLARVNTNEDLERVTKVAIRLLDNSIDLTEYPNEKVKKTQLERRAIGLGTLGEAEYIANKQIMYGSEEHEEELHRMLSIIEKASEETTRELAKEKGSCVIEGRRNAYLRAIAPNSTSGILAGTTNSIDCVFDKIWTEDNKLGLLKMIAPNLNIDNYKYYVNSYEVDQFKLNTLNSIRIKYIDQGISHSFFVNPVGIKASYMLDLVIDAWEKGIPTIYYWRSKPPKNNDLELSNKDTGISCVGCAN